jgi:hypothetical protein
MCDGGTISSFKPDKNKTGSEICASKHMDRLLLQQLQGKSKRSDPIIQSSRVSTKVTAI